MKNVVKTIITAAILLWGTAANAANDAWIKTGVTVPALPGHTVYCAGYPDECPKGLSPTMVHLSDASLEVMEKVSRQVNNYIDQQDDQDVYDAEPDVVIDSDHHVDVWRAPETYDSTYQHALGNIGDCEDMVLLKRHLLIENFGAYGFNMSNLLLAAVQTKSGDGHLILIARTDMGDLIIDNLVDSVSDWRTTGYTFFKMTRTEDTSTWVEVLDSTTTSALPKFATLPVYGQ